MSALGQKQTYAVHRPMSALPRKTDMCSALGYVRFGPKADMAPRRAAFGWSAFAATRGSTGSSPQKIHPSISGFSFTRELDRQNKLEQRAIFAIRRRSQLTAMMFDNHAAYG